ncbi:MAG: N-acetylglutaminylglutamine synthetase [Proteobacteria bacterium]|nr:N-acetylglutaminylglutamine synthetase [Pseudomonadota bacterium]
MTRKQEYGGRFKRGSAPSLSPFGIHSDKQAEEALPSDVIVECGWGRLLFAHTFSSNQRVADELRAEQPGRRDIALYLRDPHVVLSLAPQELFLDPSHTFRLWMFNWRSRTARAKGFRVRRLRTRGDAEAINRLYAQRHMVGVDPSFVWQERLSRTLTYFVAEDVADGTIIGTVTGVDHFNAFEDPEQGSSLWCLAVDPQAPHPGVGQALVAQLADYYQARGRAFMDLSVMHDNSQAIALYEKLGFVRVPVFCLKKKNPINERLYVGPKPEARLNIYAEIIVNEARRRGIAVQVLDAEHGYFTLTFGGRSITCRESLSELTNAIAMSRCDNKQVTSRILADAGLHVPDQREAGKESSDLAFLATHGEIVVKPARGEQGRGISVGVRNEDEMQGAIEIARRYCDDVLLENYMEGHDLRVIVINYAVVAASIRKPPEIVGTGQHSIRDLIRKQSRRREAATHGESRIPLDDETERFVSRAGYAFDDVLTEGETLAVRGTANLHSGGTIHDVTDQLSDKLRNAAEQAARALEIPVVGLDFLVPEIDGDAYAIIEANERPGLANHEPQPTAERFVDLLFPQTRSAKENQ